MPAMTEPKSRSRSSSLQRMLDLEKQYMRERLHAQPGQSDYSQPSTPTSPASSSFSYSPKRQTLPPPHTSIQTRRESSWNNIRGPAHRDSSLPPQLPPLVINTSVTMSRSDLLQDKGKWEVPSSATSAAHTGTPNGKRVKTVAFEFPPKTSDTKGSNCMSPSWEAYEQRKKDKKAEKKEKEELRGRNRRLVKQPPPSAIVQNEASRAPQKGTPVVEDDAGMFTRGRQRDRASIAPLNLSNPNDDIINIDPPKKPRSRSNSFVSLLRKPFEFRRSSIDQGAESDSGFIGGIKLNIQRQAARRVAQDCQVVQGDSDIHPALRVHQSNDNRSSVPLKSPPPPPRDGCSVNNPRHYPPITRGKNAAIQPIPLVSPTAPAIPDLRKIDKWRARVGLKTHSKIEPPAQSQQDGHLNGASASATPTRKNNIPFGKEPQASNVGRYEDQLPEPRNYHVRRPSQAAQPISNQGHPGQRNSVHVAVMPAALPLQRLSDISDPRKRDLSNNESCLSELSAGDSDYYTASTSHPSPPLPASGSPAPVPPRKSSKRMSLVSMSCSSLPLTTETPNQFLAVQELLNQLESPSSNVFPSNGFAGESNSPSRTSAEKPRGFAPCASTKNPSLFVPHSPSHVGNVAVSSSEESGSDDHDLHSLLAISTPATSRPQSEKSLSLAASKEANSTAEALTSNSGVPDAESAEMVHKLNVHRNFQDTTYPVNSAENSDDEGMDPIQAAAEKVLAKFNEIPIQPQMGLHSRSHSQSTLATNTSYSTPPPPPLKERPLKRQNAILESRAPSHQRLSVPMPSPLSSDHEQSDCGSKWQSLAPNSKQISPLGGLNSRPLRQQSTPMLNMRDQGPVMKVFVECCSCKYYHDMPSDLYEAMAKPADMLRPMDKYGYTPTSMSMTVKCPWCRHEMSTRCCAGFAATVYIQERLH